MKFNTYKMGDSPLPLPDEYNRQFRDQIVNAIETGKDHRMMLFHFSGCAFPYTSFRSLCSDIEAHDAQITGLTEDTIVILTKDGRNVTVRIKRGSIETEQTDNWYFDAAVVRAVLGSGS